jgi:3-hydroxyisobutyrate dehydrogenase
MSTVSPTEARSLSSQISKLRPDLHLLDSPVSGGTPRAAIGDLTILCAGLDTAGPLAGESLDVLKAMSQSKGNLANLVILPGGPGSGAAVKLVNQHLAGM